MTAAAARTINVRELVSLAEWVGAEEARRRLGLVSEWDQGLWLGKRAELVPINTCGTAACLAGRTTLTAGWVPAPAAYAALGLRLGDVSEDYEYEPDEWEDDEETGVVCQVRTEGEGKDRHVVEILDTREVREVAAEILGLDVVQARRLFDGDNKYDDVMEIIAELLRDAVPLAAERAQL